MRETVVVIINIFFASLWSFTEFLVTVCRPSSPEFFPSPLFWKNSKML